MASDGIKNFGVLLSGLNGGTVVGELSDDMDKLLEELREKAEQKSGSVSGELTLKLKFTVNTSGLTTIDYEVASKSPKPIRRQDSFFLTEGNGLSRRNERQQELPLREVGGTVEIREAK